MRKCLSLIMNNIFLIIIFLWLLILTVPLIFILFYFRKLSKGIDRGNLVKVLDRLITKEELNAKEIAEIIKKVEGLGRNAIYHIQKVGMVRFNPFEEMGGDHSFSLALLDATLSGYVITGLHTRERTRVYVKRIEKGKSKSDLSNEERESIKKAEKG